MTPDKITAGLNESWQISSSDYTPDSYTLKYYLKKAASLPLVITGAASGTVHQFTISAATSAAWSAGDYAYQLVAESGNNKYLIETGVITIRPALYNSVEAYDPRTHNQICLDNIKAVIEGRAAAVQSSWKVGTKELRYYSVSELLRLRREFEYEVQLEQEAARIDAGETVDNSQYVRFSRP